jgi:hypothetical protein
MKELSIEDLVRMSLEKMSLTELIDLQNYIAWLKEVKENKVRLNDIQIKDMFNRYNQIFQAQQYGYFCDSCRSTVYKDYQKLPKLIQEYERTQRLRETD